MPQICCKGCDEDFKFKIGDEFTYSEDNRDYTVEMRRKFMVGGCQCMYLASACDPTNPLRKLQISVADEDKMTLTNCLDVLTKLWPNLEYTDNNSFRSLVFNDVLKGIIDNDKHECRMENDACCFKLIFDGVVFSKLK